MSTRKATAAKPKLPARRKPVARPAPRAVTAPPLPADAVSAEARRLAAEIGRMLAKGRTDALAPDALQPLMAALIRLYAAQVEAGAGHLPIGTGSAISATDAMVACSGILKAVNLAVFELGMWQSWTGR